MNSLLSPTLHPSLCLLPTKSIATRAVALGVISSRSEARRRNAQVAINQEAQTKLNLYPRIIFLSNIIFSPYFISQCSETAKKSAFNILLVRLLQRLAYCQGRKLFDIFWRQKRPDIIMPLRSERRDKTRQAYASFILIQ